MMSLPAGLRDEGFAAIAPVAGAQMVACDHPSPISVLHIHGAADTHVPLDGSPGNGRGKVPAHTPIDEVLAGWRKVDGCGQPTTTKAGPVNTSTATCPDGRSVTFITIDGPRDQSPGDHPRGARSQAAQLRPTVDRDQCDRCGVGLLRRPPGPRLTECSGPRRPTDSAASPPGGRERLGQRLDRGGEGVPPLQPTFRFAVSNE